MNLQKQIGTIALIFLISSFFINTFSQDLDIRNNSFFYPHNLGTNKFLHTLGVKSANLPEEIVESDDDFRAPLIFYEFKYGVINNFLLGGNLETNFITVQLVLGTKWSHEFGNLGFSLGGDAAYYVGALNQFDFKTEINGWLAYPNLTIGYVFPNFSISLKSELILAIDQTVKIGEIEVTSSFKTISGYSIAAYLEQPLWKDNFFVIGMKANFTKFYYPIWATFSTFDRFFFIPEAIFSFNL